MSTFLADPCLNLFVIWLGRRHRGHDWFFTEDFADIQACTRSAVGLYTNEAIGSSKLSPVGTLRPVSVKNASLAISREVNPATTIDKTANSVSGWDYWAAIRRDN